VWLQIHCRSAIVAGKNSTVTRVGIRWRSGSGVSSILAFRWQAPPTPWYLPKDTELALGMTFNGWNCTTSYKFSVSVKNMGVGWTGGPSDFVKSRSTRENSKSTGGLVSNLPHPRVNRTKAHPLLCTIRMRPQLSDMVSGVVASATKTVHLPVHRE